MAVEHRLVGCVICVAASIVWLVGCSTGPAPQVAAPTTKVGNGTKIVQPTSGGVPIATSEQLTATTMAMGAETALPRAPTPGTAPAAELLTPLPTPPTLEPPTLPPSPPIDEPYYEDRSGPTNLLASYYNAVNRREYPRAWAYWESPPSPSYGAFVQGFAETASVLVAVRPPTWFEGAARSTHAAVPALVTATHRDDSRHAFVGCFVARRPNVGSVGVEREWSLFDATVQCAPSNTTGVAVLDQVCATQ